jgi:DNA-binding NarL/FixJ family response regulator
MVSRIHSALDCYHSTLYDFRWTKDFSGATQLLYQSPSDIILLDISEPNNPGLACFEKLHQLAPKAIIIL